MDSSKVIVIPRFLIIFAVWLMVIPFAVAQLVAVVKIWHGHTYEVDGQYAFSFFFLYVPAAFLSTGLAALVVSILSAVRTWSLLRTLLWAGGLMFLVSGGISGCEAWRLSDMPF